MRSTFLLASFLAVFPVGLICLTLKGLNPPIRLNQFVHSLYPRPPLAPLSPVLALPLFKLFMWRMAELINTWDAASKHIQFAALSGSGSVTSDGCVRFANRFPSQHNPLSTLPGSGLLTVENCMATCDALQSAKGGVGNNKCCACFTCLFDEHLFLN